jgi:hypothetical protein
MKPRSQYLCIVAARGEKPVHMRDVWLPCDPVIVQQIRPSVIFAVPVLSGPGP